ncbi:hypothetical protein N7449_008753 [Penicillium cf. viridicatum]|uniref:BZIP domain-containing protein n=1 Tax=Penicillium cf. viridicatum TaxID=2972119 RepID=A0A9W9M7G9_9EURO|nr:hypothetical protein N7449_008753 [Penicillium cf. viridicatum]
MEEQHKADGVPKKGRPRKFNSQHALDKRREQLRVAQQAYRTRKENTIGNLQDRVHELEGGIEQLSQSFLNFSKLLLETGLLGKHSHAMSALRKITQQHISLAKTGCATPYERAPVKAVGDTSSTAFDKNEKCSDSRARVPSNERSPTGLSSTPIEKVALPPLSTQSSFYQSQPTPPIRPVIGPLVNKSPFPLSSLPGHSPVVDRSSSIKEDQWTFSQYLVRVCCWYGYQLLVNTPCDFVKIEEVFGPSMSPTERNNLISFFQCGMHDETGILIDCMDTVITPLHFKRDASQGVATRTEEFESTIASEAGEWLDASGVQKFLSERGFCPQENGHPFSRSSSTSSLHVAALVEYLATDCVCFGNGPVFRRQTVEAALRFAGNHEVYCTPLRNFQK